MTANPPTPRDRIYEILGDNPNDSHAADAIIAALPELQGWQPIETAPKDGQTILAYTTAKANGFRISVTPIYYDEDSGWCGRSANDEAIVAKYPPTHWMPLPPAPGDTP